MYEALEEEADKMKSRMADLGRWALVGLLREGIKSYPDRIDKWHQAHELWKQWYDHDGDPYYDYGTARCFFCGGREGESHSTTCLYISVCEMLGTNPQ
jgi:hypothetical protein